MLVALKKHKTAKSEHPQNPQNLRGEGFEGSEDLHSNDVRYFSASKTSAAHEILKVLRAPVSQKCESSCSDFREMYQERAAIMEYDGGMSRAEAEAAAWADIFGSDPCTRASGTAGNR